MTKLTIDEMQAIASQLKGPVLVTEDGEIITEGPQIERLQKIARRALEPVAHPAAEMPYEDFLTLWGEAVIKDHVRYPDGPPLNTTPLRFLNEKPIA